jgi:Endonuclease/Exonuclease/phosphatase family
VIRSPAGPITVLNVHPLRTGGWRVRYSQISALLETQVVPENEPVILGGDFNAPYRSDLYEMISRKLASAHARAGFGFGFTYPARVPSRFGFFPSIPLVRIDHIFCTRQLVPLQAGTIEDSGGSDHRPVFADLAIPVVNRHAATSGVPSGGSPRGELRSARRGPAAFIPPPLPLVVLEHPVLRSLRVVVLPAAHGPHEEEPRHEAERERQQDEPPEGHGRQPNVRRSRTEFNTTKSDEAAIAPAATMGCSTPAMASGMAITL